MDVFVVDNFKLNTLTVYYIIRYICPTIVLLFVHYQLEISIGDREGHDSYFWQWIRFRANYIARMNFVKKLSPSQYCKPIQLPQFSQTHPTVHSPEELIQWERIKITSYQVPSLFWDCYCPLQRLDYFSLSRVLQIGFSLYWRNELKIFLVSVPRRG